MEVLGSAGGKRDVVYVILPDRTDSGGARLDVRRSHLLDRPAGRATDD